MNLWEDVQRRAAGFGSKSGAVNIYLNELDKYMEKYAQEFNTKAQRKRLGGSVQNKGRQVIQIWEQREKNLGQPDTKRKEDRHKILKQLERHFLQAVLQMRSWRRISLC